MVGTSSFVWHTARAASFVVDSVADDSDFNAGDGLCDTDDGVGDGPCTLRAAIEEANASAGADTITFEIDTAGVQTITPATNLPIITEAVSIDGSTEDGSACGDLWSGAAPTWNLVIEGDNTLTRGLKSTVGGNTIRGLSIIGFSDDLIIGLNLAGNGNTVTCNNLNGNYVGLSVTGANNTIGGVNPGDGNLVSGNSSLGIYLQDVDADDNLVQGNFVGTNAVGIAADPNGDVMFTSGAINVEGDGNTIGGTAVGAHNLISGNNSGGINLAGADNLVQGNYIGVDITGTAALGNHHNGITVSGEGNTIGGADVEARNVIAASSDAPGGNSGIVVVGTNTTVQGNYIGTDVTGNNASSDFAFNWGISLQESGNTIGGTVAGTGNVIGNSVSGFLPVGVGIFIFNVGDNSIQGNKIGVGADGATPLTQDVGVQLFGAAAVNNTIGGTVVGSGNIIRHNVVAGVGVGGDPGFGLGAAGIGNAILGNAINDNGLGIDLSAGATTFYDGVTLNDGDDADTGPNQLQNFPVITSTTVGATTSVVGTLNSEASTTYRLEFFASPTADDSDYGEGQIYLGAKTVTTDGDGEVSFTANGLTVTTAGYAITATASKDEGAGNYSTSEFSLAYTATAVPGGTYVVTSTADDSDSDAGDGFCDDGAGNCTLRAAIEEANATDGTDSIEFNISGIGAHTITLTDDLPSINESVVIDGTTQSGSLCGDLWAGTAPVWNIIIQGGDSDISFAGLALSSSGSTLRGVSITGFSGILRALSVGQDDNVVTCNNLSGNGTGISVDGDNNTIGGTSAGEGNVISGNTRGLFTIAGSSGTLIAGNFIGANVAGTAANANTDYGISLFTSDAATIGGTTAGAGNLISGNGGAGVVVDSGSTGTLIQGNYVGVNRAGTTDLGNSHHGLDIRGSSNTIGGTTANARNVISGNNNGGVSLEGDSNIVRGNYVGLNAAGTGAIATAGDAVSVSGDNNVIGGTASGAGNVLAASTNAISAGISITGVNTTVQGNYIGTDASGNNASSAFGNNVGINLSGNGNTVGGTAAGAGNVIGNSIEGLLPGTGILIANFSGNTIQGNNIGMGVDDTTALAQDIGILVVGASAVNNTIGGTTAGAGNTITHNTDVGVVVAGDPGFGVGAAGTGNAILGNIINFNGLGIDLSGNATALFDGVTANDTNDTDSGPNGLQNFPVIAAVTTNATTSTTVSGTFNSIDPGTYRLEFFASSDADDSGYGQAQVYLGTTTVTLSGSNSTSFEASGLEETTIGYAVSATASKDLGSSHYSTSELSLAVIATAAPTSSVSSGGGGGGAGFLTPIVIPPSPNPPALTPLPTSAPHLPPARSARSLPLERQMIGIFGRIFGHLPKQAEEWAAISYLAYNGPLPYERKLLTEQRGLSIFRPIFGHLPVSSLDWRILSIVAYGLEPLRR